jgi:recombination protein RecA
VRLDIRRIGQLKSGEKIVGYRTRVKVVKNKVFPPFLHWHPISLGASVITA